MSLAVLSQATIKLSKRSTDLVSVIRHSSTQLKTSPIHRSGDGDYDDLRQFPEISATPQKFRKSIINITEELSWKKNESSVENTLRIQLRNVLNLLNEKRHETKAILNEQKDLQVIRKRIEEELRQMPTPEIPVSTYTDEKVEQFSTEDYPWSENLRRRLSSDFKIGDFKSVQLEAINATLSGQDVLLVMSTGGGKSLCFQLPALLSKGLTLVVVPLISLMEDQVENLKKLGINAHMLHASTPLKERMKIFDEMESPSDDFKLLYVSPERLFQSKHFMHQLEKCYKYGKLSRIAIDEVHCIHEWGHDFRPGYKCLSKLKHLFPKVPIIGLSATLTTQAANETISVLDMKDPLVLRTPLNRPNLFYKMREKPKKHQKCMKDMISVIQENFHEQSGIVYCLSVRNCNDVCNHLIKAGISADVYHASLPYVQKSLLHKQWKDGKIKVMVATLAFGMGIDKSDVRFVIHHTLSKSMEQYFQESGRAGRDGNSALCLVYYNFNDIFRVMALIARSNYRQDNARLKSFYKMVQTSYSCSGCRRKQIFSHFNESYSTSNCTNMCDLCSNITSGTEVDVTRESRLLHTETMRRHFRDEPMTFIQLVDHLAKDNPKIDKSLIERTSLKMLLKGALKCRFFLHKTMFVHTYAHPSWLDKSMHNEYEMKVEVPAADTSSQSAASIKERLKTALKPWTSLV